MRRGRVENQIEWLWLWLAAVAAVKAARDACKMQGNSKETVRGHVHGTRGESDRVAVAVTGGGGGCVMKSHHELAS